MLQFAFYVCVFKIVIVSTFVIFQFSRWMVVKSATLN